MTLCGPCAAYDAAWRDSRPNQGGIRIHTVTQTAREAIEARRRRVEEHYDLVKFQRELGARLCAEGKHATPKEA